MTIGRHGKITAEQARKLAIAALGETVSPKVAAPRVTTGPILLTGLAVCATCNGGMTLRTGTSKTGGVHRYYTCSTCARKGKTVCKGRSIPMAKLDTLVTTHMNERLFQPERLATILSSLSSRRSEKADSVNARVTTLQREVTDADDKLKRLYRLIEDGMTEMDGVLKDRLNSLKADRDRTKAALERAKSHSSQAIQIDPALLERFGRTMRENLTSVAAGRPFLVVPAAVRSLAADHVVVGWKDTREARRAVQDALPFFHEAKRVTIVEICEKDQIGTARHHADDVVSYLARHRIKAEARIEAQLLGSTGADQIIGLAVDEGADLLVSGAHGHSRLNEWIFGGMTRDLLTSSPICCLMSH